MVSPAIDVVKNVYRYHCRCLSCGWEERNCDDLDYAEELADLHARDNRGHAVRVSFDLLDVEIRIIERRDKEWLR